MPFAGNRKKKADNATTNTSNTTRTAAADIASHARDTQCVEQERVREGRTSRGGDSNVYRVEVPTFSSTSHIPPKEQVDGGSDGVAVGAEDASLFPNGGVFSSENADGDFTSPNAADAVLPHAPLLTSVEEQQPSGQGSGIPSMVVLRHRMGCSTVILKSRQRKTYDRQSLEDFVLYKEQKYNAVNVLWRFCILMLLLLSFSVFCLVFSVATTEWLSVRTGEMFLSVGLFFSCQDRLLRPCKSWRSSWMEWHVTEPSTGATLCSASADFVQRYIGVLWALGIFQIICETATLLLSLRIAARPTRSGALLLLCGGFLLSTCAGIVTVVLFGLYTSCLRLTCEGERLDGHLCSVQYGFGYRLHIGAIAVHGLLLVLALCTHSYIYNIRLRSREQLSKARRQACHDAPTDDYIVRMLDMSSAPSINGDIGNATAFSTLDNAPPIWLQNENPSSQQPTNATTVSRSATPTVRASSVTATPGSRNNCAAHDRGYVSLRDVPVSRVHSTLLHSTTTCPGASFTDGVELNNRGAYSSRENHRPASMEVGSAIPFRGFSSVPHGGLHVSFADVADEKKEGDVSGMLRRSPYRRKRYKNSLVGSFDVRHTRTDTTPTAELSPARHQTPSVVAERDRGVGATLDDSSDGGGLHGASRWRSSPGGASVSRRGHSPCSGPEPAMTHSSLSPRGGQRRHRSEKRGPARAHQRARKHRSLFLRFFNREYDPNYLTAVELGVPIAGATDWVYDDRSDMYYSFDRDMFWDPITQEYYNCVLKSWQESPDQMLEVRDVLDYMFESPPSTSRSQSGD